MDFSQTSHSLLSTTLLGCIYKPNVLLHLFSYKMRIVSKCTWFGPNSQSFLVHFLTHDFRNNYAKFTTESWPHRTKHIVVLSYLYPINNIDCWPWYLPFFLGVISNTDQCHFRLPNFPEALNHISAANQQSSFAAGNCAEWEGFHWLFQTHFCCIKISCDLPWFMREDCVHEIEPFW